MGAVRKYDKFVKKYLKKTGRRKTLIEFEKSLQRKQPKGTCCRSFYSETNFRRKKACKAEFCDTESPRKDQKRTRSSKSKTPKFLKKWCCRKESSRHSRKILKNCEKIWTSGRTPWIFLWKQRLISLGVQRKKQNSLCWSEVQNYNETFERLFSRSHENCS